MLAERYRKALFQFVPALGDARGYNLDALRRDVTAGLTVAFIAVPQSMAYAIIAGVDPVYGIYTVILQCLIGSLLNSQRFLSVGPINTQSLLVASTITLVMRQHQELSQADANALYLQLTFALTLIKGVIQIGFAAARLGVLVRYVSQSVIVGFTAGAGVLIAAGQINNFLGFSVPRTGGNWPGLIGIAQRLYPQLHETSLYAVIVGVVSLAVVLIARKMSQLVPGPLIAIVVTAAIVALSGWTQGELNLVGELPKGLPGFHLPVGGLIYWDALLSGAVALALLGLMEAYSIGSAIAGKTGQRISANQELLSQGTTNFVTGFFQCIPGSGSFSRSALNFYAGAKTAYSGVFNSIFVAAIFLIFSPYAKFIPLASLAAILFVIAYGLIDWTFIRRVLKGSRADALVCISTFTATLCLPLAYAVFVGVFLNIALYLRKASQLHIAEMVRTSAGPFVERPIHDRGGQKKVIFLQIEGDLFFAMSDELRDRLREVGNSGVKVVIFRLKRTLSIDATILDVFEQFTKTMKERDGYVILCGVRPDLMENLRGFGLVSTIGEENIFETKFGVFTSAQQALRRARKLLGSSIDTDDFEFDADDPQAWAYQI